VLTAVYRWRGEGEVVDYGVILSVSHAVNG
jgi:hypothetical protein